MSEHLAPATDRAKALPGLIREAYGQPEGFLPLHAPVFEGRERKLVLETIDSTFVSSVGQFVDQFEAMLAEVTGARHAVACVNGTAALQIALTVAGVRPGDMVLTQSLSFAGTANAIAHAGAVPAFVDVDLDTLGLSPKALSDFLENECEPDGEGGYRHRASGRRIGGCVPMHSFGHPVRIEEVCEIGERFGVPIIEDAAESLGSRRGDKGCGSFGRLGILSFNGNKIVTTGGGGAIVTNDPDLAKRAKHLTTTAKVPDRWRFFHDEIGWNFRLPNINAALGCAQLERLADFIEEKRSLAARYAALFEAEGLKFLSEPDGTRSNYWLCAFLASDRQERDAILAATNDAGVMTRPIWEPLHTLPAFKDAPCGPLPTTLFLADRLINIPSGVRASRPIKA